MRNYAESPHTKTNIRVLIKTQLEEAKKRNKLLAVLKRQLEVKDVHVDSFLGKGHFGEVFKGRWEGGGGVLVAMKTLKFPKNITGKTREKYQNDFVREAKLLRDLSHPNIVTFYGIHDNGRKDEEKKQYMITEFMDQGSLLDFLKRSKKIKLNIGDKIRIAIDICKGMKYLHSSNIRHGDLAARNILLEKKQGGLLRAKISDFGKIIIIKKMNLRGNEFNM